MSERLRFGLVASGALLATTAACASGEAAPLHEVAPSNEPAQAAAQQELRNPAFSPIGNNVCTITEFRDLGITDYEAPEPDVRELRFRFTVDRGSEGATEDKQVSDGTLDVIEEPEVYIASSTAINERIRVASLYEDMLYGGGHEVIRTETERDELLVSMPADQESLQSKDGGTVIPLDGAKMILTLAVGARNKETNGRYTVRRTCLGGVAMYNATAGQWQLGTDTPKGMNNLDCSNSVKPVDFGRAGTFHADYC